MKKSVFYLLLLITVLFSLQVLAQNMSIKVKVINPSGYPVNNASVLYKSGGSIHTQSTNSGGIAVLHLSQIPDMIIVSDNNNKQYGITTYKPNQSAAEYTIRLHRLPGNQNEAGKQIERVINTISKAYGYYDDGMFFAEIAANRAPSSLGVPGLFSISPLPRIENGKVMLVLDGILVSYIVKLYDKIITPKYIYALNGRTAF
jgi:hypothetical protein